MTQTQFYKDFESLPVELQQQVADFMEFLKQKTKSALKKEEKPKLRKAGSLKGKIWISDDFDAPLEDFRDYM